MIWKMEFFDNLLASKQDRRAKLSTLLLEYWKANKTSPTKSEYMWYMKKLGFSDYWITKRIQSLIKLGCYQKESRPLRGKHTIAEWRAKQEQYGFRCIYCGKSARLVKDHIVPISRGGSNLIGNIVPSCRRCNSVKYNRLVEYFKEGVMLKLL